MWRVKEWLHSQLCSKYQGFATSKLFREILLKSQHTSIYLPQKLDELAKNNKKHHLQLTNDYPWSSSPSSTYSTWESESDVGCAWSFPLTLIAFAAEDNIIISSCRPQSMQLVNNKPSWTEACEAPANPGIILLLLLLFAHYFSSPLAEDSQLNYFHPIVSLCHRGQISIEEQATFRNAFISFQSPSSSLLTPLAATRWWKLSLWVLVYTLSLNVIMMCYFHYILIGNFLHFERFGKAAVIPRFKT